MALIVEVQHADGSIRQRLKLFATPVSIGRALHNLLVLDDPYVDAQHAQIVRADTGELWLEDLGSLNKLVGQADGAQQRLLIAHDTQVLLGQTLLRFRDEHAAIEAALALPPSLSASLARALSRGHSAAGISAAGTSTAGLSTAGMAKHHAWYKRLPGQLGIIAFMLTAVGAEVWLESIDRTAAAQTLNAVLAAATAVALWTGLWSVLARVATGRFRFLALLTASAAATAIATCLQELTGWGAFLWPDNRVVEALLDGLLPLLLLAAFVATLLSYASHMKRSWCIWGGVLGSVAVLATYGTYALLENDEFSAVATFAGEIKPVHTAFIPTDNAKALHAAAITLKADVDEMLADGKL